MWALTAVEVVSGSGSGGDRGRVGSSVGQCPREAIPRERVASAGRVLIGELVEKGVEISWWKRMWKLSGLKALNG